jgi:hypothetical protein
MSKHCGQSGCSGWEFQGGLCRKHMQGSEGSVALHTATSKKANPAPGPSRELLSEIFHSAALQQEENLVNLETKAAKSKMETQQLFDDGMAAMQRQLFPLASQKLMEAAEHGHGRAHAEWSWLLFEGALGIPQDRKKSFELAQAGHNLGCGHSTGALALCYFEGYDEGRDDDDEELPQSEGNVDAQQALLLAHIR